MSKTCIINCDVPDFTGVPPSTAVSVRLITDCFSRSKGFCRMSSADTFSPFLYVLISFCPTSAS
uniref:Uncharacterized protein n=2 Tax=Poecilia TaxID=8080 RepID=A0A3B3W0H8_9TELE